MTDTLKRVIAFAAGRYSALNISDHAQAHAFLAIINQCRELELSSEHAGPDLLDWLSRPRSDPYPGRAYL